MKFKEEFINEVIRRIKENMDIVESSFNLANIMLVKSKIVDIDPIPYRISVLLENDPYLFLNKLIYTIINKQEVKVSSTNIACDLLLELVNLVLEEFGLERIGKIAK